MKHQLRLGIWQSIPSPAISRYLVRAGWQWIVLDMQHGALTWETAAECIHTIRQLDATVWVRVGIGQAVEVQRALDLGAQGIVVPMVNSEHEARRMAAAAKYPPRGERSVGGDLGIHFGPDSFDHANHDTILAVQIEHLDAVHAVETIMAVEGVNACFVGPADLALSMGLSLQNYQQNSDHQKALQRTLAACRQAGKMACCNTFSLEDFAAKKKLGFDGLTFMSDVDLLVRSGRTLLRELEGVI